MLAIVAVHLAAAMAFWLLGLGMAYVALVAMLLLMCLASLRARSKLDEEWWFRPDGSVVRIKCGTEQLLRVRASSTVFEWGVWLHWLEIAPPMGSGAHLWLPDQFAKDDWRRLKIWLRHYSQ